MKRRKTYPLYRVIRWLVWLFSPKMQAEGTENIPPEPVLIVGNHTQMYGPIACEFYSPVRRYTWCAGEMMELKDVPAYAYRDFWSQKPKSVRWLFRILSYIIAPLAVVIFNNAETIPVWHDNRIIITFRRSMEKLQEGASMVIFPEQDVKYNHILYDFQERFVDLARLYYKKTGQALAFVPLYITPALKKMVYGTPIRFRPEAPIQAERERICAYLKSEITRMACALPRHRVVPYRNIPKKDYPYNIPCEVDEP